MRILLPFVGDSVGGSHRSAALLLRYLKAEDVDVVVVLHNEFGPLRSLFESIGVGVEIFPRKMLVGEDPNMYAIVRDMLRNVFSIVKYIRKNGIDVVHGNDLRINLTWSVGTIISGRKFVWHQRTVLSNSWKWKAIRYLSNHCICISKYVYKSLPTTIDDDRKSVIYNPFDEHVGASGVDDSVKELLDMDEDSFVVIYAGRLVAPKHVNNLVKAVSRMNRKNDTRLLIVGAGNDDYVRELKKLVRRLHLENVVTFVGFVLNSEDYIRTANVLVSPGEKEGMGRSVVESMLMGVPVVASKSGAHEEIIFDKENGLLYELHDIDGLSNCLTLLMNDGELYSEIQERAMTMARKRYGTIDHGRSVLKIYRSLKLN